MERLATGGVHLEDLQQAALQLWRQAGGLDLSMKEPNSDILPSHISNPKPHDFSTCLNTDVPSVKLMNSMWPTL